MNRDRFVLAITPLVKCGNSGSEPCGYKDFIVLLVTVFNYLIYLVVPLSILGIGVGGLYMIFGSSNEAQRTQGKDILWYSIFGLVVAAAAWVIVNTILVGLGATGFDNPLN